MSEFDFKNKRDSQRIATLDCETPEIALHSVSNIFGLTRTELIDFIKKFDLDDYIKKYGNTEDRPADIVLKSLLIQTNCNWGFSHTAWFHMTRCLPTEEFELGLKPLLEIIDDIWELLFKINPTPIERTKLDKYRELLETDSSGIYQHRIKTPSEHGPDGNLVNGLRSREDGETCIQDHYLKKAPEIIICICEHYNNLLNEYTRVTRPCIVKFETPHSKLEHLSTALYYVYERLQPEPEFDNTYNANYIGNGVPIYPDKIKKKIFS
jgi:hypothetical protein